MMGHRTITISEEAYQALSRLKQKNESFTEAILRLTKGRSDTLLDYIKSLEPDEFVEILEKVVKERRRISLREPGS